MVDICYTEYRTFSGSYNGRRAVSETDKEGPIPSPEALFILGIMMTLLTSPANFAILRLCIYSEYLY